MSPAKENGIMKLIIGSYEVEVKARATWRSRRTNAKDTGFFLNHIANAFFETGDSLHSQGFDGMADRYYSDANDIMRAVNEKEILK